MKKFWEKVIAFFTATDKQLHMLAGFAIAASFYIILLPILPWWACTIIGSIVATGAIVGKEFYDKAHPDKHSFEVLDIVAGEIGVLVLIIASLFNL